MQIKSKYEIGQRIWVVYENQGEVSVYDDYIDEICVNNKKIYYILKNTCIDEEEKDIVLYEDTETLVQKIKEILEKEGKKNENTKDIKKEE